MFLFVFLKTVFGGPKFQPFHLNELCRYIDDRNMLLQDKESSRKKTKVIGSFSTEPFFARAV